MSDMLMERPSLLDCKTVKGRIPGDTGLGDNSPAQMDSWCCCIAPMLEELVSAVS